MVEIREGCWDQEQIAGEKNMGLIERPCVPHPLTIQACFLHLVLSPFGSDFQFFEADFQILFTCLLFRSFSLGVMEVAENYRC